MILSQIDSGEWHCLGGRMDWKKVTVEQAKVCQGDENISSMKQTQSIVNCGRILVNTLTQ